VRFSVAKQARFSLLLTLLAGFIPGSLLRREEN
jgi:hypothetical protein